MEKINNTTYKDSYEDTGVELIVGDEKQDDFYPRTKLKKWDNESNLSIGIDGSSDEAGLYLNGERITWLGPSTANFYPLRKERLEFPDSVRWLNLDTLTPIAAAAEYELFRTGHGHDAFAIATYRVSEPSIMVFGSVPAEGYLKLRATTSQQITATEVQSGAVSVIAAGSKVDVDLTEEERLTATFAGKQYYIARSEWKFLKDVRAIDFDHEDKSSYLAQDMVFPSFDDLPAVRIRSPDANPYYMDENLVNVDIHYGQLIIEDLEELWTSSIIEVFAELGITVTRGHGNKLYFEHEGRSVKFHSGENARGILACYINIDCDYNKNYDFYRDDVDRASDVRDNYAYGIKKAHPSVDLSVIRLIVEKFAGKIGVSVDETPYSGEELSKWEKIKLKHDNFEWVEDCRRYDAGWHYSPEDDGFEFEVELTEPPSNLIVPFSLQAKNCDFFYQERLSREQRLAGEHRYPNVEGSYAVYRSDNKYPQALSKVCHIYRPFAIDKDDNKYFCEIQVESTETVGSETYATVNAVLPPELADSSLYPIILDPTIGYSDAGASGREIVNNIAGSIATTGIESGPFQYIDAHFSTSVAVTVSSQIYLDSDNSKVPNTNEGKAVTAQSAQWTRIYYDDVVSTIGSENTVGSSNPTVDQETYTAPTGTARTWTDLDNLKEVSANADFARMSLNNALNASNPYSNWLTLDTWGFNVPTAAEIIGIDIRFNVNSSATDACKADAVKIVVDSTNYEDTTDLGFFPSGDNSGSNRVWLTWGGESSTWSVPSSALTPANINSNDFATAIRLRRYAGSSRNLGRIFEAIATVYYFDESSTSLQAHTSYKLALLSSSALYATTLLSYDTQTNPGDQGFQQSSTSFPDPLNPTLEDTIYSITATYRTTGYSITQDDDVGVLDDDSRETGHEQSVVEVASVGASDESSSSSDITSEDLAGLEDLTPVELQISSDDPVGLEDLAPNGSLQTSFEDAVLSDEQIISSLGVVFAALISAEESRSTGADLSSEDNISAEEEILKSLRVQVEDACSVSEIISSLAALHFVEAVNTPDEILRGLGVPSEDDVGGSDSKTSTVDLNLEDSAGLNEVIAKAVSSQIEDNLGAAYALISAVEASILESVGGSTQVSTEQEGTSEDQETVLDIALVGDVLSVAVTLSTLEISGLSDPSSRAITVSLEDLNGISEQVSHAQNLLRSFEDTVGNLDTTPTKSVEILPEDFLKVNDQIFSSTTASFVESILSSDDQNLHLARLILDTVGVLDALSRRTAVNALDEISNSEELLNLLAISREEEVSGFDEILNSLAVAQEDKISSSFDILSSLTHSREDGVSASDLSDFVSGREVLIIDPVGLEDTLSSRIKILQDAVIGIRDIYKDNLPPSLIAAVAFAEQVLHTALFAQENLYQPTFKNESVQIIDDSFTQENFEQPVFRNESLQITEALDKLLAALKDTED